MTFSRTNSEKNDPIQFYKLSFRIVRFKITENTYETVLTNLSRMEYPAKTIKDLYARRWGMETSFRNFKYTVGMLNFHSKKVVCIKQEIYAHLIMYNFAEMPIKPGRHRERNLTAKIFHGFLYRVA
ncbi:transposase [Faecalicatena acetigenes]|uniref:Transposase n=1 Tax=Faecalicatena acetigenes TaxID=2981790 RepID=A0ABT2TDU8_9FIRM|nr:MULTISPECIES: transposase [Lachnospiraceae]MCU6748176.1 transposase [Faecalicatena acetigenes]